MWFMFTNSALVFWVISSILQVGRLGTGSELPYRMALHPGGDGLICAMPKSCGYFASHFCRFCWNCFLNKYINLYHNVLRSCCVTTESLILIHTREDINLYYISGASLSPALKHYNMKF